LRRNGFCPAKVVEGIFPAAFVQRKQTAHEIEVWREVESAPFLFFGHGFLKSIQDRFRLRRPAKRAVAGDPPGPDSPAWGGVRAWIPIKEALVRERRAPSGTAPG
jgi:hypothetical protein